MQVFWPGGGLQARICIKTAKKMKKMPKMMMVPGCRPHARAVEGSVVASEPVERKPLVVEEA